MKCDEAPLKDAKPSEKILEAGAPILPDNEALDSIKGHL
jgi:hypothetical protein